MLVSSFDLKENISDNKVPRSNNFLDILSKNFIQYLKLNFLRVRSAARLCFKWAFFLKVLVLLGFAVFLVLHCYYFVIAADALVLFIIAIIMVITETIIIIIITTTTKNFIIKGFCYCW